jgi:hypothetical protein
LVGDEFVEIGVGEPAALATLAVAKGDVFQRARLHVAVERLDRAAQLARGFGGGAQAIGQRGNGWRAALTLGARGLRRYGLRLASLKAGARLFHFLDKLSKTPVGAVIEWPGEDGLDGFGLLGRQSSP